MKSWKCAERRIAAILGGQRVPVSGRGRGDAPDVNHETLSVEIKTRKSLPSWLLEAMKQAEASARGDQLPTVVLHQDSQRYANALVVIRLSDLAKLLEEKDEAA